MELLHAEDFHRRSGGIAARSQGNTAEQIEADPDPPRVVLVQVRDRAQPTGEAEIRQPQADQNDDSGDDVEAGEERSLDSIHRLGHHDPSPAFSLAASSSAFFTAFSTAFSLSAFAFSIALFMASSAAVWVVSVASFTAAAFSRAAFRCLL